MLPSSASNKSRAARRCALLIRVQTVVAHAVLFLLLAEAGLCRAPRVGDFPMPQENPSTLVA